MKIKFIGTGQMSTKRRCTSFVVNDSMLFDIGFGTIEGLKQNGLDTKDIKTIVISHTHADHSFDIIQFLHRRKMKGEITGEPLVIVGPKGIKEFLNKLNVFGFGDISIYSVANETPGKFNFEVIELGDNQTYKGKDFTVKAFKVLHGSAECNGYFLKSGKTNLGYSGDSSLCDGLTNNIKNANTWIIESNDVNPMPNIHLGLGEVLELAKQHNETNFYVVHRKDYETPNNIKNVFFPFDNEVINVD